MENYIELENGTMLNLDQVLYISLWGRDAATAVLTKGSLILSRNDMKRIRELLPVRRLVDAAEETRAKFFNE